MKYEKLLKMLKEGESEHLEFKIKVTRNIGEEICAFANTDGGTIFIGIADDGRLLGCDVKAAKERISQYLNGITPPIKIKFDRLKVDEKEILAVVVPRSDHLCGIGGTVYIRTGTSKRPLSLQEILVQGTETLLFEIDKTPTDLLPDERYIEKFSSESRVDIHDIMQYLKNMGAITDEGKLTLAGLLMFHDNPQSSMPHTSLRMIFQDGTWKRFIGPLWKIVDELENELRSRFTLSSIEPGFRRYDIYEYPMKAVREGVINALVHKNYAVKSEIFIELEKTRLIIKNPGSFPPGTTPENPHPVPRNPILYELMFQMGYVERQGRGIQMIKDECREHPFVSFVYRFDPNFTELTFKKDINSFSEDEKEIISLLAEGEKSANHLATELNISKVTVLKKLDRLIEQSLIERVGSGPATRYKLGKKLEKG